MGPGDALWESAVDEIARMPGVAERLVDAHRPDEHGRCLACTTPGVGTAYRRWPCGLYRLGSDATKRPAFPRPELLRPESVRSESLPPEPVPPESVRRVEPLRP